MSIIGDENRGEILFRGVISVFLGLGFEDLSTLKAFVSIEERYSSVPLLVACGEWNRTLKNSESFSRNLRIRKPRSVSQGRNAVGVVSMLPEFHLLNNYLLHTDSGQDNIAQDGLRREIELENRQLG
ncbi:uncharacterized protein [Physcomitrium patens]|uniref:uncharacterized protein n=1 Tax=Physcomitrium patens TaxID=3218 RepID=UPI003CCE43F7